MVYYVSLAYTMRSSLGDVLVPGVFDGVIARHLSPSDIRELQTVSRDVNASIPRSVGELADLMR